MNFKGKKVIITGATGYIGSHIVKRFLDEQCIVGCICRDIDKFNRIFGNTNCFPIIANIVSYNDLQKGIMSFYQKYGEIDILVNCAGGGARERAKGFVSQSKEVFDEIVGVNLLGTMYVSQLCLRYMRRGSIVNISSYIGVQGRTSYSEYAAAKGGIIALTKSLAKEFAGEGIRINCISPGLVPRPEEIEKYGEDHFCGLSFIEGRISADDIVEGVLFLASENSKYVVGHNLIIDGGASLSLKKIYEGEKRVTWQYYDINADDKYIIYATGNESKKYVDYLIKNQKYYLIDKFSDSDDKKWGTIFCGKEVIPPKCLLELPNDMKIIIASIYYKEIYQILKILGIDSNRIVSYRMENNKFI